MTAERIVIEYPCRIQSEANLRGSWRKHDDRRKAHRHQGRIHTMAAWPNPRDWSHVVIKLTRIAPCLIRDEHDNLPRAFKATADGVAEGLGVDDGAARITWAYAQEKRSAKTARTQALPPYAVRIEIIIDGCATCQGEGVLRQGEREAACPFCEGAGVAA